MRENSIEATRVRSSTVVVAAAMMIFSVCVLCVLATSAHAASVRPVEAEALLPEEEAPFSIAVNSTTHHIYVSTGFSSQTPRVFNLDPDGTVDPTLPELPGASVHPPYWVAVDNSGGAHNGYIYTSNLFTGSIQQYDSSGAETSVSITAAAVPPDGTAQGGGLPPVSNSGEFSPRFITVSPSGNLYVPLGALVDEFTPAGTFVAQIPNVVGSSVAVDAAGNVYSAGFNGTVTGIFEVNQLGECIPASCDPIAAEGPALGNRATTLALDVKSDTLFVVTANEDESPIFQEYTTSGELLGTTPIAGKGAFYGAETIAVDETANKVVVGLAYRENEELRAESPVRIYGPAKIVPDVEATAPSQLTGNSATLNGKIDAAGVSGATCVFQYVDDESFKRSQFEHVSTVPCSPGGPYSGSATQQVTADVTGLTGGTTYHYRLIGANGNGESASNNETVTTLGPSITGTKVVDVSETGATLEAEVNPNGVSTSFYFEYVTQADFEAGGYASAVKVPDGGATIGEELEPVLVAETLEGLSPATDYRFRVIAQSSDGAISTGPDQTFKTFAPSPHGLPDDRAYELVSPTQKNGANVDGDHEAVQASIDGNRITYTSYAGIPGGVGQQQFASYLASRAPDGSGWTTQGQLPPASTGSIANTLGWDEELRHLYDWASAPLVPSVRVMDISTADRSLTDILKIEKSRTGTPLDLAASTTGGGVVLLESTERGGGYVPGDRPEVQNIYAYAPGTSQLVVAGVLNDGSVPIGGAFAGPYNWYQNGTPESGGAQTGYYDQNDRVLSSDGHRIVFTAGETGQIYVRENPFAEQSAMNGEECTEPAKACTVQVSKPVPGVTDPGTPAAFVGASADGSVVYFVDKGKLTADSTASSKGRDLYRFDLDSRTLTDLTVASADSNGAKVEGVLGVSADGGVIDFVARGALASGATKAPEGEVNLYSIHGDSTEYVARLGANGGSPEAQIWIPKSAGGGGVSSPRESRVSADGESLIFRSFRNLTSYDSGGEPEIYLHRTGEPLRCISCNPTGERSLGPAGLTEIPRPGAFGPVRNYSFLPRNLSSNGRRAIFDSADQLVAADRDQSNDVYEWEQKGEGSCGSEAYAGGCIYLLSGGTQGPSYFGDTDPEGRSAFFFTTQQLVAVDRDQLKDLYVARVGGGIAAQNELPARPCEGEACLGPAGAPPGTGAAGSSTFHGPGNPAGSKSCGKGKVRRHGKCVKKNKPKKHGGKHHGKRHKKGAKSAKGGSGK